MAKVYSPFPLLPTPAPQRVYPVLKTSMSPIFGRKVSLPFLILLSVIFFFGSIKRFALEPREFLDSVLEMNLKDTFSVSSVLNKMKLFTVCPFLSKGIITQMTESYVLWPRFTDILKFRSPSLKSSSRSKGICIFNLSCCNCKIKPSKKLRRFSSSRYCHFIPRDLLNQNKTSRHSLDVADAGKFHVEAECTIPRAHQPISRPAGSAGSSGRCGVRSGGVWQRC